MTNRKKVFSNSKLQIAIVLIIMTIAVIFAVLAGTKTYVNSNRKPIPTISQEELQHRKTIKSSEDMNLTKDWKTYVDSYHKYSFKYPATWSLKVTSANNGTNVYLFDENDIKRMSFIGIPYTQVCDRGEAEKNHEYKGESFQIGDVQEGSGNGCGIDKYPVDLPDLEGNNITLFFEFVGSPSESTAREILKTVNNLKERGVAKL